MMNHDKPLHITTKQSRFLNIFWLGFTIYCLIYAFPGTNPGNTKILQAFQILGLILMFPTAISLIQFKFDNSYLRLIYILYCIWLLTLILRGNAFLLNYSNLKLFFLGSRYGGMLYFTPLILLFPRNLFIYKKVFDIVIIFGIIYIIYSIFYIKDLLNSDRSSFTSQGIVETFSTLSFSSGFLLLTLVYQSKKRQLLAIGVTLFALLFAIVRARRGLIFMYVNMILLSYILYVFNSKMKVLIIYFTVFIALLGAVYVSGVNKPFNNRIFEFLINRGDENTRLGVELYFYDDMKTKDWIIGRGIKGEYFCPDIEKDQITNYRSVIETGYLQTILNGGLISLGLFLIIAIPAIIKGLFYSRNIFSKAAAIWIFMSLINSYPSTVNTFTLQYLLVWISIGICYSEEIRNMPESSMKEIFLT